VEDPAFGEDPRRHFTDARAKHPWIAASNIGFFVHEFTAIRELLAMDDKLRPGFDGIVEQLGAQGTPWGRFTEEQMISLPTEKHRLLRDTFVPKFGPRSADQLRSTMQLTIKRLLDQWVPKGEFDFEEFASYFPISVIFALVGAPIEEVASIRESLETLGLALSMDKSRLPAIHGAFARLEDLVQRLIADRRASAASGKQDDLLKLLLDTADEGSINHRQLADLLIFLFIAGYDTSKNVLTFTMYKLLQHPVIYKRCATDHDYCRKVLDESLRYYNPGSIPRFTRQQMTFRDVLIPKDTMLWFPVNIAGRDPGVFDDAETFDPERQPDPKRKHLAFGLGKHMCLGQHIARAQLQEALHQIARRILNPRLAGEFGWRLFPGIWGLKGLPIRFTPSQADI